MLIVILVFLQDWRAVLVPATTVPVTIIGAFAAMAALGFTVNMLTLFGLVLAIGIVVDDAIVIVENAAHHIDHDGLDPKKATIKAMAEVIGPVIGITLVLMAVFLPDRLPRRDHRPALPPVRPDDRRHGRHQRHQRRDAQAGPVRRLPAADARAEERLLPRLQRASTTGARRSTPRIVRRAGPARRCDDARCSSASSALTGWWFTRLPTGFLPTEDQGYAIVGIQLPDAASQARTRAVVEKVETILKKTPGDRRAGS